MGIKTLENLSRIWEIDCYVTLVSSESVQGRMDLGRILVLFDAEGSKS